MTNFDLLKGWPSERQEEFLARFPRVKFADRQVILECGDCGTEAYFIAEGGVKVLNYGPDGEMSFFAIRPAGDCIGYLAAISEQPRTATVIAHGPTTLIRVSAAEFLSLATNDPLVAMNLLKTMERIIREDAARLTALTTLDAQARVIGHILTEHARQQSDLLTLPDRADWASQLGMSRETMSRILNGLAEGGMIGLEKGGVRVINSAGLGRQVEY